MTSRLREPREADHRATEYPLGAESFAPVQRLKVSEPSTATAAIFVSGVQKELAEERRALKAFIEGDPLLRRFFTVFLFEDLPAADARADAVYLDEVDRSALYVGIFADEYGFEDTGGVSPTEREFDRATQQGKPRLIFVKGSDDRARHAKMAALVRRAGDQLIRRRFAGTPDLTAALYASLVDHLERTGRLRTKPFDAAACPEATLADLSPEKLDRFLARAQAERGYPLPLGTSMEKALAHLNLLDGQEPSHAAVLLFGNDPQRFVWSSEIKCMHFHGTEVLKPIPSYQIYKGTVFELVDQALDFVMSKIARRVGTRDLGPTAPVSYEVPWRAVAEAIVNAVAHREYASNASAQVMLFADRLEVWNPGELPPPLTVERLRQPHPSIPHNPLLADPLFLAGYIERAGTGTLDMIARVREAGLPEPEFRQDGGTFVQVLRRPRVRGTPEVTPQVTPEVSPALRLVRTLVGEMTRQQIQRALGLKDEKHFREVYLHPALEAGLIEMTIPDKPRSSKQKYRLTTKGAKARKK
jgi:predicted HTH transcriptional regulator